MFLYIPDFQVPEGLNSMCLHLGRVKIYPFKPKRLLMQYLMSILILLSFGCGEFKTLSPSTSPSALNSTISNQQVVAQKKTLQRVLLDFGSPFVGNLMTLNHYLVDKEELTIIFSNIASQSIPLGRVGFLIMEPDDNPGDILSVILQLPGGGSIANGTCANSGCAIYFNIGDDFERRACRSDVPTWYFPAPGTYKIIATYKDQTVRSIEFKANDPCSKFLAKNISNLTDRFPASIKSSGLKQKKKDNNKK